MIRTSLFLAVLFLVTSCTSGAKNVSEDSVVPQTEPVIESTAAVIQEKRQPTGKVNIIGGDEESLRDFIQRWFAPIYWSETLQKDTTIWIGELPQEFLEVLPLPDDSQVIASVQDPSQSLQVIVDLDSSLDDFLATYPLSIETEGWHPVTESAQGVGFVSGADSWFTYCNEQQKTALTVQAFPNATGETEVRFNLYTENSRFWCDPDANQPMDPAYNILPTLKMPPGAWMKGGGSSSGDGTADSSSDIQTDLSLGDLMAHFSSQLQEEGWQFLDGSNQESFSWSSWLMLVEEAEWRGTMIMIDDPVEEDLIYAMIRVVRSK